MHYNFAETYDTYTAIYKLERLKCLKGIFNDLRYICQDTNESVIWRYY